MEQQLLKQEHNEIETEVIWVNPDIPHAPLWLLTLIWTLFGFSMFWFIGMIVTRGSTFFDVLFFVTILGMFVLYIYKEYLEEKQGDVN